MRQQISAQRYSLGCDPELFITKDGKVVGSELVIPATGLDSRYASGQIYKERGVVRDGVQAELNPASSTCRQGLAASIALVIASLRNKLTTEGYSASFSTVVTVEKDEMDKLSAEAKRLGCQPSLNAHDTSAKVTQADDDFMRSAGGHIHIGCASYFTEPRISQEEVAKLSVPILDILLENSCVLLDRDPNAAKRRAQYGRAGEHRLPSWGLEYRTLSNFWLRHYVLMSFVTAVARLAVTIGTSQQHMQWQTQYYRKLAADPHRTPSQRHEYTTYAKRCEDQATVNPREELLGLVSMPDIVRAINTNDADLAWANWGKIKDWCQANLADYEPLCARFIPIFEGLAEVVQDKGLNHVFPNDPLDNWAKRVDGVGYGWEAFCMGWRKGEAWNA